MENDATEKKERDLKLAKLSAEVNKLELESQEVRYRLERKWYQGRFLLEGIIGGAVAGALFVTWFVGIYSPRMTIEIEREKAQHQLAEIRKDRTIQSYIKQLEAINDGFQSVKLWTQRLDHILEKVRNRMKSADSDIIDEYSLKYLWSLHLDSQHLVNLTNVEISRNNAVALRLKNDLAILNNSSYKISIVFRADYGLGLAEVLSRSLESQGYVVSTKHWRDHRYDNESMGEFFKTGPVILFDRNDDKAATKRDDVERSIIKILPKDMVIYRMEDMDKGIPDSGGYKPAPGEFDVWLFSSGSSKL